MSNTQEEIDKMSEQQKIEKIINDIQNSIDNDNKEEIHNMINQILMNVKNFKSGATRDKIVYTFLKFSLCPSLCVMEYSGNQNKQD